MFINETRLFLFFAGVLCCTQAASPEVFGNRTIAAEVTWSGGHLHLASAKDLRSGRRLSLRESFVIHMKNGTEIDSSQFQVIGLPVSSDIGRNPESSRAAERLSGKQLCANLNDRQSQLHVKWCLVERDGSPYLRQQLTIQAVDHALEIASIEMFRVEDPMARVVGSVNGSPVVSDTFFLGFEHPLSYERIQDGMTILGIDRSLPLLQGQSVTYTGVIGTTHSGQLRRDFLAYIEQERAHPYRPFLHYNSWWDLGFGQRYDTAGVLDRMHGFGEELVRKRGVTMNSFLLDDGWDDTNSLWEFSKGFQQGLTPLYETAQHYGFGLGIWLSPWGGYVQQKKERIAYGRAHGYEVVADGYALSGPNYYAKFEARCLDFVSKDGVNQFKLDGTGNVNQVIPGSPFDSDFSAAIHLVQRLRQANPDLYINLTNGTKPTPFWLQYVDSIWRGGSDNNFAGEGSWRQRWLTYRDSATYSNVVKQGPLFPLNSLMIHGIIYAKEAKHLSDDPSNDFADEVRSFFGSGTQLQEMYITPSLMTQANWDTLAESAKWSRTNAEILKDTHWIGGDPGKGEVYGWASWNANHGILVLRNPTAHAQEISVDVQDAFELPAKASTRYIARSPWKDSEVGSQIIFAAHQPQTISLSPFQVLVLQGDPDTTHTAVH
jgi:hypothetical protein